MIACNWQGKDVNLGLPNTKFHALSMMLYTVFLRWRIAVCPGTLHILFQILRPSWKLVAGII